MIEGHDIICFANDWDGDPLSKKHIMTRLAKKNRVLWVNSTGNRNPKATARDLQRIFRKLWNFASGVKRVEENIYTFTPIVIPFHGSRQAQKFNQAFLTMSLRVVCRQLKFSRPITWTFAPSSADVVGTLGEQMLFYHCVDEFSEFTGAEKRAILDMERRLIQKSNAVVVCSSPLYKSKCRYGVPAHLVTHGVDVAHFRQACEARTAVPDDMASLQGPVVGFFGLIEDWVDLALIRFLAESRPAWNFVLIGKAAADTAIVRQLPNVHLLGRRGYAELPGYCKAFDVAILPFAVNELTLNANPLKLREYLAAGLPVVSTAIPEAERLDGMVRIGQTPAGFLGHIDALIASGQTGPDIARSRLMDNESWDCKVEQISRIIEQCRMPASPVAA